jgi:hypothetical protein
MNKKKAHDARRHRERMAKDLKYRMRKIFNTINHRCNTTQHKSSKYYNGKGIQNFLTVKALCALWQMYDAGKMVRPSIDRYNSDGHYEIANCRFVELSENVSRAARKYWRAQELMRVGQ